MFAKTSRLLRWLGLIALSAAAVLPMAPAFGTGTQGTPPASGGPGLTVVESDSRRVVVELGLPDYSVGEQSIDGVTYALVTVPGLSPGGSAGQPQLPASGALIGVPPGAQASVRALVDDWRRDVIAHAPLPVPAAKVEVDPTETLPSEPGLSYAPDPSIYGGRKLYPAEVARLTATGNWRSQPYVRVELSPLQYDPAAGQLVFHRRLQVEVAFGYPSSPAESPRGETVDEGPFEPVLQKALANYETARNWRQKSGPAGTPSLAVSPGDPSLPWYKVALAADGIYQITCPRLADAGIDVDSLDPRTLKVYKGGAEMAVDVAGEADGRCDDGDYLVFYGEGARTKYTDTNIYWLTHGGAAGRRMERRDGSGGGPVAATFTETVHFEEDRLYRPYYPRVDDADHWFWRFLPSGGSSYTDFAVNVESPAAGAFSATLQTTLFGTGGSHRTRTFVNGNLVEDAAWSDATERRSAISFPQSYLSAGPNTVRIDELGPSGSYVYVNSFDLSYVRTFGAVSDTLRFRHPAGVRQYDLPGFTEPVVEAFDISDPFGVARIVSATLTSPCPCSLSFGDFVTTTHEYLAITPSQRRTPSGISRDSPSDLRSAANGADYVVIAYGGFITGVAPLASLRAAQGMRAKVVDVQDVYDEFSDGLMDAQAIRDFLAYAYANWQPPAPYYVLLVGDGNFDFLNRLGVGDPNYIPPYLRMVDPWIGETASDSRLVAFEDGAGNPLPQMAIGRLPVGSVADVQAMVSKIVTYEQNPPAGDWRTKVGFIADRAYDSNGVPDSAGNFWVLSDGIADNPAYITATLTAERIYYNNCDSGVYPQCAISYPSLPSAEAVRRWIVDAIDDGRLIVNYIGHSSVAFWGKDQIFRIADLSSLANGGKTPVMLAMTCYDGYFHYPGYPGLAEVNVRLPGKGALASWSATGLGVATGHDFLNRGFFAAIVQQRARQVGTATMAGKANLYANGGGANRDLIDTFNLLGDPASRLALPAANRIYLPIISK